MERGEGLRAAISRFQAGALDLEGLREALRGAVPSDAATVRATIELAESAEDWRATKACLEALARSTIERDTIVRCGLKLLDHPRDYEDYVQEAAVDLLGAMGPAAAEAVPELHRLLRAVSLDSSAVRHIVEAYGRIGAHPQLCVPFLLLQLNRWNDDDLLYGKDCGVATAAYLALGSFPQRREEIEPSLLAALGLQSRDVHHLVAAPALKSLARLGTSASKVLPRARALAQGLVDKPNLTAELTLTRLLDEELGPWREGEPDAFFAAFLDLSFNGQRAVPEAFFLAQIAAGTLRPASFERLKDLLRHRDALLRVRALKLLAGTKDLAPVWRARILPLMEDPASPVRVGAIEALAALGWSDAACAKAVEAARRSYPEDEALQDAVRRYLKSNGAVRPRDYGGAVVMDARFLSHAAWPVGGQLLEFTRGWHGGGRSLWVGHHDVLEHAPPQAGLTDHDELSVWRIDLDLADNFDPAPPVPFRLPKEFPIVRSGGWGCWRKFTFEGYWEGGLVFGLKFPFSDRDSKRVVDVLYHFSPASGLWTRVGKGLVLCPLPEDPRAAPQDWAIDADNLRGRMRMEEQDDALLVDAQASRFNVEFRNPGESRPFCVVEDLDELVAKSDPRYGGTRPLSMKSALKAFALRRAGGLELALYLTHTADPDGNDLRGTLLRVSLSEPVPARS